jgi:hypothetical protein
VREPFVPWYHSSTLYLNRVNVSNIFNRNAAEVRSGYNQRATSLFPNEPGNHNYANRSIATVAMNQDAFASGRPVASNQLRGQQFGNAPIVPHPLVTPERTAVASAPARALPPRTARPTLASRNDSRVKAPEIPTPTSVAGPGGPRRTGPIPGPTKPPTQEPAPVSRAPIAPVQQPNPTQGRPPVQAPAPKEPEAPAKVQEPNVTQGRPPVRGPVTQPIPAPQPERPLFNKAVPPEPRPSFEKQQQAIQQTDPGRPLSPRQMDNVRQNQPAGPAQTHEAPHPAPAPVSRPAPPPPQNNEKKK